MLLLAAGSFLSQMMLLVGMILLAWILVRRNIKMRGRSRAVDRELKAQQAEVHKPVRGAPLADAPKEVLRWQASMFDLQRELKAELDSRVLVVESLLRRVDQRVEELRSLQLENSAQSGKPAASGPSYSKVRRLAAIGFSAEEISQKLDIPQAEIELSLGLQAEIPQPSSSA
ncbi:hypothetical protein Poly24_53220 [Rosistilla carotiformis]|uniref:DUF2802 domain-containing protein n=1 Tax=Rosistilla carotiformis TaxID=2528017 RepID=A0A518K1B0_9BACT|nr:DUF2802 domain-containing protein [Rosistilla carotiformis]QDV71584.1 hypothetical protein Poly24_53220 [Rosistilla carotiformis]